MLDTHAVHHALTESGLSVAQADANAATRADLGALEARVYRAMLIQAGAIVGAVVALLRMLGS